MPEVYPVTALGFEDLVDQLGIQVGPRAPFWWLSDTILPVSLVNTQVPLAAEITARAQTLVSAGPQAAPVTTTVLADTGALAAGTYTFGFWLNTEAGGNSRFHIAHRNAGDTADVFLHEVNQDYNAAGAHVELEWTITLATNERIRITQNGNASAGSRIQATILQVLLP